MDLLIRKKNEVYLKVEAEPHINYELADFFTFEMICKVHQKTRRYKGGMERSVYIRQLQVKSTAD